VARMNWAGGSADAEVARSILEANGIPAHVNADKAWGLNPAGNWAAALEVSDDHLEAAQWLLDDVAEASPPADADDEAPRTWLQHPATRIVAALAIVGVLFGFGGAL
jgi:hypothetical protein